MWLAQFFWYIRALPHVLYGVHRPLMLIGQQLRLNIHLCECFAVSFPLILWDTFSHDRVLQTMLWFLFLGWKCSDSFSTDITGILIYKYLAGFSKQKTSLEQDCLLSLMQESASGDTLIGTLPRQCLIVDDIDVLIYSLKEIISPTCPMPDLP